MEEIMVFTIGFGEVVGFVIILVGAAWSLITMSLNQFEKRLDSKLVTLDTAVNEIKRLELEIVRNDARAAQTYTTKADQDKALERIFNVLERVENCLTVKISREEVEKLLQRSHKNQD